MLSEKVFAALEEFGLSGQMQDVKHWYDGFRFGCHDSDTETKLIMEDLLTGKSFPAQIDEGFWHILPKACLL